MKILFVNFTDIFGGGEVFLKYIIEAPKTDVEKYLVSPKGKLNETVSDVEIIEGYARANSFVSPRNFVQIIKQVKLINKIITEKKIDVIFLNGRNSYYLASLINKNVSKIGVWHGINLRQELVRRALSQMSFSNLDKIIVVSDYQRTRIQEVFGNKYNDKIKVVKLGVKDRGNTEKLDTKKEMLNILIVARLEGLKGHSDLVKAFYELNKKYSNIKLTIVGEGDEMENIKQQVKQLNLNDKVDIIGFADPTSYYKTTDIFVLPSYTEGIPLVIMEAMSHCLPIIATNVGGVYESVEHGYNGYLFTPGDINEMVAAFELLINSEELRNQMGQNSRKIYEEKFNIERMYTEIYKVIEGDS